MPIPRRAGRVAALAARLTAARLAPALLALSLLLGACVREAAPPPAPEPAPEAAEEPSPVGATVGIVLPPVDEVDERLLVGIEAAVAALAAGLGPGIRDVRTYRPAGAEFVADLVGLLTERGTDLVCVVGSRARGTVLAAAELYPELSYCAVAASSDDQVPDGVLLLDVRTAELGRVVGIAAAGVANDRPVGLVLSSAGVHGSAFRSGLLAGLDGVEVVEASVSADLDAERAVEDVLAAGAQVVIVDGVPGAAEALELAGGSAWVLGPAVVLDRAAVGNRAVLVWRTDWAGLLRQPIERLLDADDGGATTWGFAEEAFSVEFGAATTPGVRRSVEETIEGIVAGRIEPLEPASSQAPPDEPPPDEPTPDEASPDEGP